MLIFWFRRDLRLNDNSGFYHALRSGKQVLPLFIFDSEILDKLDDRQDARVTFIHETILKLHEALQGEGSTLIVKYGKPLEIFEKLLKEYNVEGVYTNHDYEPYALERDKNVKKLFEEHQLEYKSFKDQVIFERDELLTKSGTPYRVYTPYKNTWLKAFDEEMVAPFDTRPHFKNLYAHKKTTVIPLQELGFEESELKVPIPDLSSETLKNYDRTRDIPALDATSRIGAHLRFGKESIRHAVQKTLKYNKIWLEELIWREFFMQLLYHFPESSEESFSPKFKHIEWKNNEKEFEKWCAGKTGFPLVDAGMRQLNQTGFMHNRVRMVTGSFLVKDLLIDWKWGEAYFAAKLLDYEMASNIGNWQWVAGTGADAQPYFRVFNPDNQIKKFDKDLAYIKKWIPEYGTPDYPDPMVDHTEARDRAIIAFKKAIALTIQ